MKVIVENILVPVDKNGDLVGIAVLPCKYVSVLTVQFDSSIRTSSIYTSVEEKNNSGSIVLYQHIQNKLRLDILNLISNELFGVKVAS